ncbi:MAG: lysophospholipid acyltransferase family protein, partial [Thermodesulfovibrionales bacterium]
MMVLSRKILRLTLFILVSLFFLAAGLAINILFFWSEKELTRMRARAAMSWSRTLCRIMGIRVSREGDLKELPRTITMSNHISYLDILVLGSLRPSLFVSRHDVKAWPLLGLLARVAGTVFIDRESTRSAWAALDEVEKRIESGSTVVVFPEGTTTDGMGVKEFKGFFFMVPIRMKIAVQPLSIRYNSSNSGGDCPVAWYGGMTLLPHLWNLIGIERIDALVYYNPAITSI